MNILIFNASSFGRRSITSMLLNSFIAGVRTTDAVTDTIQVNRLSVKPCRGDLSCWFKTKGTCIQSDDMHGVLERVLLADVIVFSTPVYCDGVPAQLKAVMDRFVALGNPFLEIRDNHTRHPLPKGYITKKFVLISSCGLWEKDNFDPIIMHCKAFCKNLGFDYAGSLLRPHSFVMRDSEINDILQAAKQAGCEIGNGCIVSEDAQIRVSTTIMSREGYCTLLNNKASSLIQ